MGILNLLACGVTIWASVFQSNLGKQMVIDPLILTNNKNTNYTITYLMFSLSMLFATRKTPIPFYFTFPVVTLFGVKIIDSFFCS
jgi:hypothetical protein